MQNRNIKKMKRNFTRMGVLRLGQTIGQAIERGRIPSSLFRDL